MGECVAGLGVWRCVREGVVVGWGGGEAGVDVFVVVVCGRLVAAVGLRLVLREGGGATSVFTGSALGGEFDGVDVGCIRWRVRTSCAVASPGGSRGDVWSRRVSVKKL